MRGNVPPVCLKTLQIGPRDEVGSGGQGVVLQGPRGSRGRLAGSLGVKG